MLTLIINKTLDLRDIPPPMPMLKVSHEVSNLLPGEVIKIICTEKKSLARFRDWIDQTMTLKILYQEVTHEDERELYIHYIKCIG